jgi:hypothetical protein
MSIHICRYAYTDQLELSNLKDALEIQEFCSNYNISSLKNRCENYISKFELDSNAVWEIMDIPNIGRGLNNKINLVS